MHVVVGSGAGIAPWRLTDGEIYLLPRTAAPLGVYPSHTRHGRVPATPGCSVDAGCMNYKHRLLVFFISEGWRLNLNG